MKNKLIWLIILLSGIFKLALADTVGPIRSMPPNPVGHYDIVESVAFSPDGSYILSGSNDKTMKLWDVSSGAEIHYSCKSKNDLPLWGKVSDNFFVKRG